jgi:hypothetical protein
MLSYPGFLCSSALLLLLVHLCMQIIFLISVLSAAASAPFNVFVDILFEDILSAPLADEFRVNIKAQHMSMRSMDTHKQHLYTHAPVKPRNMVRSSAALANTATTPVFTLALPTPPALEMKRTKRLSSTVMNSLVVPNASIRLFPPSVIDARATLAEALLGSFQDRSALSLTDEAVVPAISKMKSRMTVVRMSMLLKKSLVDIEPPPSSPPPHRDDHLLEQTPDIGEEESGQISPYSAFIRELGRQHEGLGEEARLEMQERWG